MALTSILNTAYLSAGMSFPERGSKLNLCFIFKRRMSFCNIFLKKDECNNLKVKWTKTSTFFILAQFYWNMFNMNRINILWSFSSIETSIPEIFAIKNCSFLALIFIEWSEKLSIKTACDVNVGLKSTWRRNCGGLCSHKPRKNKQYVFKSCKLWL